MGKDPNKPKRGLSAFMFFSTSRRPQLKKQNPNLAFGAVAKKIGEEWAKMSSSAKAKYEAMSTKDKARYKKEMETYVPAPASSKKKKKRKKKDPDAPKRPKSSYMCFATIRRPELVKAHPNWDFGKYGKVIGEEWRGMSASKKAKYEDAAAKDKKRYAKEMKAYTAE